MTVVRKRVGERHSTAVAGCGNPGVRQLGSGHWGSGPKGWMCSKSGVRKAGGQGCGR